MTKSVNPFPLGRAGSKDYVDKTLLNDLFVGYGVGGSNAWGRSRGAW